MFRIRSLAAITRAKHSSVTIDHLSYGDCRISGSGNVWQEPGLLRGTDKIIMRFDGATETCDNGSVKGRNLVIEMECQENVRMAKGTIRLSNPSATASTWVTASTDGQRCPE